MHNLNCTGNVPFETVTRREDFEMVVRIRIVTAPPSNVAPDEVREAWVGVEMNAMPDGGNASG